MKWKEKMAPFTNLYLETRTFFSSIIATKKKDLTKIGFGAVRSKRFALVADDLKVTYVGVETG